MMTPLEHSNSKQCFIYLCETQLEAVCSLAIAEGHLRHPSLERESLRDMFHVTFMTSCSHRLYTNSGFHEIAHKCFTLCKEKSSRSED